MSLKDTRGLLLFPNTDGAQCIWTRDVNLHHWADSMYISIPYIDGTVALVAYTTRYDWALFCFLIGQYTSIDQVSIFFKKNPEVSPQIWFVGRWRSAKCCCRRHSCHSQLSIRFGWIMYMCIKRPVASVISMKGNDSRIRFGRLWKTTRATEMKHEIICKTATTDLTYPCERILIL